MVDEFKTIRDNLFKALMGGEGDDDASVGGDDDEDDAGRRSRADASAAKAIIATLFARAGKGKDEVVQTVAREIGTAVAAMLKEPLAQLAKNQKLQISFEFVPKTGKDAPPPKGRTAAKAAAKKTARKKGSQA